MQAATAARHGCRAYGRAARRRQVGPELDGHLELHAEVLEGGEADPRRGAVDRRFANTAPASGWSTPTISCMAFEVRAIL